jgi:uncharacterized protein involved in outer membrane biogenesis
MASFFQNPIVRRVWSIFRWCRITVWLAVFVVVAAVAYLHLVGLPDYVKRPMLRRLEAHGITAEFSNMQLGWRRGPSVIIEDAAFKRFHQPLSPRLSARRAELELSWDALLHSQVNVRSLLVSSAQLELPVSEKKGDALVLNNVALDLQFYSNDVARLETCRGLFLGIQLDVIGGVTHVSQLRDWKFPLGGGGVTHGAFEAHLRQIQRIARQIHFNGTPVLQIETGADGGDINTFHAEMNFRAPEVRTPWGRATALTVEGACARLSDPGRQTFLQVKCSAENPDTPWGRSRLLSAGLAFARTPDSNFETQVQLDAADCKIAGRDMCEAAHVSWKGAATLAASNFLPVLASGELHLVNAQSRWGTAREITLEGEAVRAQETPANMAGYGPWRMIAPWIFNGHAETREMVSPKLQIHHLSWSSRWRAPLLTLENFRGELYDGHIDAEGNLDVASREFHGHGTADFDPHAIARLLSRPAREWLAQLEWSNAPKVNTSLRVILPSWENPPADPAAAMDASLQIAGDFTTQSAAFRGMPVRSASGHVAYADRCWHVSRLHADRPDGEIDLDYTSAPQGFKYIIDSRLDPKAAIPLLPPGREHILDKLTFRQPPVVHAEIHGGWQAPWGVGFTATVRATNFVVRGEPVAFLNAGADYTNLILIVNDLSVSNRQFQARLPWSKCDFGRQVASLTNAAGRLDPTLLNRLLQADSPDFLKHLRFDSPPSVSVSGSFSLTNALDVDLHFLIGATPVHYEALEAGRVAGTVDWTGSRVAVTRITATPYNGSATGWIIFDSKPGGQPDFNANFSVQNIDLSALMTGLTGKTNKVEGRFDSDIALTGPITADRNDWRGHGDVRVYDALLWDIKPFGLLSPVLDAVAPGAGNSRARSATASFVIAHGAVTSEDLAIHSSAFRLNYRGSVTMDGEINARVEAALLRDMPMFGRIFSTVFSPVSKLFEYHIKGTLQNPVMEPVFVPRVIMELLHPFKTLKDAATPLDKSK